MLVSMGRVLRCVLILWDFPGCSVGAAIGRPAAPSCEFAETNANAKHFSARTRNARPYMRKFKQLAKSELVDLFLRCFWYVNRNIFNLD